jgi:hypothetical protein
MADPFAGAVDSATAPASRAVAVTPHDVNPLADIPKALFVGGGGTVTMRGLNDSADTVWQGVAAGTILPFRARFVRATGTTATAILALY